MPSSTDSKTRVSEGSRVEVLKIDFSKDELLATPPNAPKPILGGPEPIKRMEAMSWLRDILGGGPLSTTRLIPLAKNQGYSPSTLTRAGRAIGVRSYPAKCNGRKRLWALQEHPKDH